MALKGNSIAVNTGDNATCLATDQRGEIRPASARDIAAFEFESSIFFIIPAANGKMAIIEL